MFCVQTMDEDEDDDDEEDDDFIGLAHLEDDDDDAENVPPATKKAKKNADKEAAKEKARAEKPKKKTPVGLGSGVLSRKRANPAPDEDEDDYRKVPRRADDQLFPKDLASEIKRLAGDACEQYAREKQLTQKIRTQLFRGIVTYLFKFADVPLLERYITNVTVHAVVQVIVERQESPEREEFTLLVEPWEGERL